ncbi:abc transporter protein, partial [Penicillium lividum]
NIIPLNSTLYQSNTMRHLWEPLLEIEILNTIHYVKIYQRRRNSLRLIGQRMLWVGLARYIPKCSLFVSGKSSFLLAMLRLSEIEQGDILVDGLSLRRIQRNAVRRAISVMPQEPTILPGNVRMNFDPFGEHSDHLIIEALSDVGLWNLFSQENGLDTERQRTLSQGQEQLISLARCLLRRSNVVLLDEVTTTIDSLTEGKIMEVIAQRFANCTVVAVAHRLHTIRYFDRIVVFDKGRIVESGAPEVLLNQTDSVFRALWDTQHVASTS